MIWFLEARSFPGFFAMVLLLFVASGVGNASTFQMVPGIMRREVDRSEPNLPEPQRRQQAERETAAVIGFTSAIAAYGAFYIPKAYGSSIELTGSSGRRIVGLPALLRKLRGADLVCLQRAARNPARLRAQTNASFCFHRARLKRNHRMSHFLDRLTYFRRAREKFSDGHGITTNEAREWEDAYRKRWAADKIVRSTHGVNCTGSCSWKIYVKGGIVTWETQQTDYPRTRPDLPNHEPRGCPRGASYSWYLYSGTRIKYPLVRARLIRHWREARKTMTPVAAWKSIVQDADKRRDWVSKRGRGGFVRVGWDEVTELIAAANAYTIKEYGPDRIAGFSPIPAMSMISYAAGSRYLSLDRRNAAQLL